MNDLTKVSMTAKLRPTELEIDVIESVALARIIEEVRNGELLISPTAYNRTYHRHNR